VHRQEKERKGFMNIQTHERGLEKKLRNVGRGTDREEPYEGSSTKTEAGEWQREGVPIGKWNG